MLALTIYLIGFGVTCYFIHRNNIKNAVANKVRTGDERYKAIEDPGSIIMLGFFWPLVGLCEGITWVADSSRNGYQAYVDAQVVNLQAGEDTLDGRWEKLKQEEARLEALKDKVENAQSDDKTSI